MWYLDDGTLGGDETELVGALCTIEHEGEKLGLHLNLHKCELICQNPSAMQSLVDSFPSLKVVKPSDATLLGSPLTNTAVYSCLESKIHQLQIIGARLQYLESHDALVLLRHALAIPKLLHVLRSSSAFSSPLLKSYDDMLSKMISQIANNDISTEDPAWLQASLPVASGGLGIRSAVHLAPSAFLASADAASSTVIQLLPGGLDPSVCPLREAALSLWKESAGHDTEPPHPPLSHRQKSWDVPCVSARCKSLVHEADSPCTRVRLLATSSQESGAWLSLVHGLMLCHAPP